MVEPDGVTGDTEGEHGDGGLGSQGMHTTGYTYHLREGGEPKEGIPEQIEETRRSQ